MFYTFCENFGPGDNTVVLTGTML